jgi:hypothetical protein
MEQSSWETDSHSPLQKIPPLLWNLKVRYRVYKRTLPAPVLSLMNPVHTFPLYFLKIHFNIILPSSSRSSEWSLPFMFSNQNCRNANYLSRPSNPLCFYHPSNIWQRFPPPSCQCIPFRSRYSPQHSVLKHTLCFLPLMWETEFHTYTKQVKQ